MSGGHHREAQRVGAPQEAIELEMPVAFDAGIGRDARGVGVDIWLHDTFVEVVAEIEHVMLDAQLIGDATGIVDIGDRATAAVGVAAPELHRHPVTAKPRSSNNAAATDESTPPDIATSTSGRAFTGDSSESAQSGYGRGYRIEREVDIGGGRRIAEREA
jgi:hypothetical protein